MTQETVVFVGIVTAVAMVVLLLIFRLLTWRLTRGWKQHRAETVEQWEAEAVEFVLGPSGAQFGGLESLGVDKSQHGLGYVALTDQDLRITRAAPSEQWCLTHKQIKGVILQPAFLGRQSKKTPFIVVRFVKDGKKDRLGFQVKTYRQWAETLAETAKVPLREKG